MKGFKGQGQKRERDERLYARGFQAGLTGRSQDRCPYHSISLRQHWMAGWRDGRVSHHEGLHGIAALHLQPLH